MFYYLGLAFLVLIGVCVGAYWAFLCLAILAVVGIYINRKQIGRAWERHPYFSTYWSHALTVLLIACAVLVGSVWLVVDWRSGYAGGLLEAVHKAAEPILIGLAAAIATIASKKFSNRLGDLRTTELPAMIEDLEDQTYRPFRSINHSYSVIRWTPLMRPRAKKYLRSFYLMEPLFGQGPIKRVKLLLGINIFEQLVEDTGTENFRIVGPNKSWFLRVYKNIEEDQMDLVKKCLEHLDKKNIFSSEMEEIQVPDRLSDTHKFPDSAPFRIRNNRAFFFAGTLHEQISAVQVFKYAKAPYHYRGREISELESVARKFGRLEKEILKIGQKEGLSEKFVRGIQDHRRVGCSELSLGCRSHVKKIEKIESALRNHEILQKNKAWDGKESLSNIIVRKIKDAMVFRGEYENDQFLLHDVHPHNVLSDSPDVDSPRECVLIYDLGWVGYWNHNVVWASAMHRFVREYARQQLPSGGKPFKNTDAEVVKFMMPYLKHGYEAFKINYLDSCGSDLKLDENIEKKIDQYIMCANVDKLIFSLEIALGLQDDPLRRDEKRHLGEVYKFVRFIEEARIFHEVLN